MVQTTDISSHAKWEFNCRQFLRIMGPSVPPYAKEEKKTLFFFPPLSPLQSQTTSKYCQRFSAEASTEVGFILGTSCRVNLVGPVLSQPLPTPLGSFISLGFCVYHGCPSHAPGGGLPCDLWPDLACSHVCKRDGFLGNGTLVVGLTAPLIAVSSGALALMP